MRKIASILSAVFSLLVFLSFSSFSFAQFPQNFAEDEIIVKLKPNIAQNRLGELNWKLGNRISQKLLLPQTFTIKVPKSKVSQFIQIYEKNSLIEYAEPNYRAYALEIPNDTYFSNQWGVAKVQAPQAFDLTHGLSSVKIAIVDTGIDKDHEDLAAKTVARVNFTGSQNDDDIYGHGTHVAGIAAAITNNSLGVAGLGYEASLASVKVLDDSGSGYYSWVANGIIWAADNGVKVINLSLGGSSSSRTLQNAVNYAWNKGVVLACAAGNSGNSSRTYPGYYSNCIATAATDSNDQKASWSSYGSWVDVAAPGVNIFSTMPNHPNSIGILNYGYLSGTSMATPHVAGLAGLLFGYNFNLTNTQVRGAIETYADDIYGTGTYWSQGRINAYRSLLSLLGPTPTPTPTATPTATPTPTPTPMVTLTPTPTPTPTPPPAEPALCWNKDNGYLYRNNNQAKKFCKCAQGSYGYNSYRYNFGSQTVYYYTNSSNNENWNAASRFSNLSVNNVTCTDGLVYPTNQNYYWPK
ncbi:MAG: S8 family peptidase [Candidatus Levybacteria bacterium]|nr:S8 family peptidase [Candidatus Levybacteria bacterium]